MTSLRRAVCRDCFAAVPGDGRRCPACSSPRLAFWPADEDLTIAHIDCDAFYAAVEKRDNPTLADKPLIIGGGKRGVVATACYVARTYGVRSAMPMFKALAACPDAVVIKPDMAKYVAVGRDIRARMERLTPLVEPLSIDEAFLDLTGTERVHDAPAAVVLARFAAAIERDIGVTVSVGLSYCKFLAKVASDLDKPRGFATIGRADALSFLATRPVGVIWGVGRVMQDKLARDGITLIGDLQRLDEATLMRRYGGEGQRLSRLSRGIDTRPVDPVRDTKSVSAETTFGQDLDALPDLTRALFRLCERVSSRLKAKDLAGRTVTLKLKTNDFRLRTRARALPEPTQLAGRLFEAARELLAREVDGTAFRLIGIGTSDLAPADLADRGDLVDVKIIRDKAMERAVDTLRARFGGEAIGRGIGLGIAPRRPVREP